MCINLKPFPLTEQVIMRVTVDSILEKEDAL